MDPRDHEINGAKKITLDLRISDKVRWNTSSMIVCDAFRYYQINQYNEHCTKMVPNHQEKTDYKKKIIKKTKIIKKY